LPPCSCRCVVTAVGEAGADRDERHADAGGNLQQRHLDHMVLGFLSLFGLDEGR